MDMTSSHPTPCRCRLHSQLEQRQLDARRHARYRELANAILGPSAPRDDADLAHALAQHAGRIRAVSNLAYLPGLRAA